MPAPRASDLNEFLNRRRPNWSRLELLLRQVESGGLASLSAQEVREFGILYRRASSDLMTARARTANAEVLEYLNDLVARAYAQVYRSRRFHLRDAGAFLRFDFPRLFRHAWKYMALSGAICLLSMAAGWELSRRDPAGAYYMLPAEMVKSIPTLREHWKGASGHSMEGGAAVLMPALSSWLMSHNIAIGLTCFAGGLLAGIPTLYVTVQTGMMLGILGEGMTRPDTALVFWSLILPHGVVEIPAIVVMCGAGFILAGALLAPGSRTRRDALIERGRVAVLLALGGGAMLVLAGLIEGFITPPDFIPPQAKLLFALTLAGAEAFYFARAGSGGQPGLLAALVPYEEGSASYPRL